MLIRSFYVSYFMLVEFGTARRLQMDAQRIGIKAETLPRNDGKAIIMEYPSFMGRLDWLYRINSTNGDYEASRVEKMPNVCYSHISLEDGAVDGWFDVIEHKQVNYETMLMKMASNRSYYSKFRRIVESFPDMGIKQFMEDPANAVSAEILFPHEVNTSTLALPSYYKYQGDLRGVGILRVRTNKGGVLYGAIWIIDYGKETPRFSFDTINGWCGSLSECMDAALAYFYDLGKFAEHYGTMFWDNRGVELKFKKIADTDKKKISEYTIGEKVKIKSHKWYNSLADNHGNIEICGEDGDFSFPMSEYCGRTMTITRQLCHNQYELDGIGFWFPDWCFDRVVSTTDKPKSEIALRPIHNRKERTQKTYLMRDENTGCTKIGKSVNPRTRERTLLSDKPTITLFMVCEKNVEKILHKEYADKNVRGEWFNLTAEDIADISKNYNFYSVNNQ